MKIEEIKIIPTDNSIRALGDVNIEWDTALFELFNNSIQAAEDRDSDLNIVVKFDFEDDNESKIKSLRVLDESGGIKREDIQSALTPGSRPSTKITLSEHGFGLNVALEFLTKDGGTFNLISHLGENSYLINDRVSYENPIKLKDHISEKNNSGLEVVIYNPSFSDLAYPTRAQSIGFKTWIKACAKYRHKYQTFIDRGKKFDISFHYQCGDRFQSRRFSPLSPVLNNPLTGKQEWLTSFTLQDEGLKVRFNLGVAENNREKYKYSLPNGHNVWSQIHPYIGNDSVGFETIYKDVIIRGPSLEAVPVSTNLVGGNWTHYNLLRGEMYILKGGKSVFTKDGIQNSEHLSRVVNRAVDIFTGKEPHPDSGIEINYIKEYVSSINYSKGNVPKEAILKHRHRVMFESFGCKVRQEEPNAYGIIDMIVDDKVLEHKRKETTVDDILQIFKYMVALHDKPEIKGYELYAPSHSDRAKSFLDKLQNNHLRDDAPKIELKILPEPIMNSHVTDEEREIMRNKK